MELILINKNNEELDLLNNRNRFILTGAEALHGIDTDISEIETPYSDGTEITSVKALPRSIELTFALIGNVEESLKYFTAIVKSKQIVTLKEVKEDREIIIKGVATIPPYSRMSDLCKITLTIYCNKPYWQDLNYIVGEIALAINLLNFPEEGQYFTADGRPFGVIDTSLTKTFVNEGDVEVGMQMTLTMLGAVINPQISCISGEQNSHYMRLNVTLQGGDIVVINSVKNNKYITINGSDYYDGIPCLSYLEFAGEDWLKLETGENVFLLSATSGEENVYFNIIYKRAYE